MYSISWLKIFVVAACCLNLAGSERAFGQARQGEAAIGSWRDDKPGIRRLLRPEDLPAMATPTYGLAQVVPMPAGAQPQVPDGFSAERVATPGLHKPRATRVAELNVS